MSRRSRRRGATSLRPSRLAFALLVTAVCVGVGGFLAARHSTPDLTASQPAPWVHGRVRVEVANGGGVPRMARAATGQLRVAGFDVVNYGNAKADERGKPTVVIDRAGRMDVARAVADALGIDNVVSDPDPNLYVDVSVVLGEEWAPGGLSPSEDIALADRPRWNPRSWFGL